MSSLSPLLRASLQEMRVVGMDEAASDLLLCLLCADPAARPTARQVPACARTQNSPACLRLPACLPAQQSSALHAQKSPACPPACLRLPTCACLPASCLRACLPACLPLPAFSC